MRPEGYAGRAIWDDPAMRRLLAFAVVLALAAAGCGGGDGGTSKEDYAKSLADASQTLQKTFADILAQTGSGSSTAQTGARLDKGADALDDAADRFAAIDPPSDAKSAHDKLVSGLHDLADVFRKGAAAAKKGDTKGLTSTLQGLAQSAGVKKITEAQKELEDKGVTVTTTASGGG
jgi:hypothetical protein